MTKGEILKIVQELPEDATVDDAIERLYLWAMVQKAEEQIRSGQAVPHDQAKEQIMEWLKE